MIDRFSLIVAQGRGAAGDGGWRSLQDGWTFSGYPLMSVWSLAVVVAVLMLVIAGLWAWRRRITWPRCGPSRW